jgi:hypothetical protein
MATHDYVISNASGAAVRADLNNALAAIVSNNSNATEPSTTYSYMLWADTGSSPPVMKLRNAANDGWVTLFQLDGEWSVIPFENGSASAPSIYFKDSGTDTGFYSPGTDQVGISTAGTARLTVDASGTVEITSNAATAPFIANIDTTEVGRWDSSGRLLVGTSTSSQYTATTASIQLTSSDSAQDPRIQLKGNATTDAAAIDFGGGAQRHASISGDGGNFLVFTNSAAGAGNVTERMRIDSSGRVGIGKTPDASYTTTGVELNPSGYGIFARSGDTALYVERAANDGTLVSFSQAGNVEGSISVSGATVSYNQFLGAHWAALFDWSRPEIKIGTILETINELTDWKYAVIEVEGEQKKICYNGTAEIGSTVTVEYEDEEYEGIVELETNPKFNKAVKVKVNDTAASKAVYGVFVGWNTDSNGDGGIWNDMYVGAVGNYVIRMAAGQEPEIGDLVEADGTGCAVVQDDDIIRTKTVAKITSTIPQVTYDDGSFLVTCVLYCG